VLSAADIARGAEGAFGFLVRDPAAPSHFDNTFSACLRSFRVMVLAAPLFALYLLLYYSSVDTAADEGEIVAIEALHFVVDWLLFPVLFYEIARHQRWLDRFPRYISALNWINLPVNLLAVLSVAVVLVAPRPVGEVLDIAMIGLYFYWFWMATRLSLGVDALATFLLLIVNWVPSFLLSLIVDRVLGVVPLPGT